MKKTILLILLIILTFTNYAFSWDNYHPNIHNKTVINGGGDSSINNNPTFNNNPSINNTPTFNNTPNFNNNPTFNNAPNINPVFSNNQNTNTFNPNNANSNTNTFNPSNSNTNAFNPNNSNTFNPSNNNIVGNSPVNVSTNYEEMRQMAVVSMWSALTALRFKEGAHSTITDSRIMSVDDIIDVLDTISYEDCKRGKGGEGDVKIVDGLIRPQFHKTTEIKFHKSMKDFNKSDYRFIGWVTGIAGNNDISMENVVYGLGQYGMDNGATDLVKVKESATEWGDTSGYGIDATAFITSIFNGFGRNSIGPGASGGAGINGMKGGSADRGDCKFAVFVSNAKLEEVSKKFEKKE